MAKKITLETIAAQMSAGFAALEAKIEGVDARMERGFAAVAGDIARIDERIEGLATKEQILTLQTQVNSIEQQLRETKTEVRLGALEEKVFGVARR